MKEKDGNSSITARQWDRAAKNNSRGNQLNPDSEDMYSEDEEYSYYSLTGNDHNDQEADNTGLTIH